MTVKESMVLICLTAPCRWMIPDLSAYQAGARVPKGVVPVHWMVLRKMAVALPAGR